MNKSQECREYFLDGVTDVSVYEEELCVFPYPNNVTGITYMPDCELPAPAFSVSTRDGVAAMADSISVKASMAESGRLLIYTYEISVTITEDKEYLQKTVDRLAGNDNCCVVLHKEDGSDHLCYSLPGTFAFSYSVSGSSTGESRVATISLKSLSELLPMTILS